MAGEEGPTLHADRLAGGHINTRPGRYRRVISIREERVFVGSLFYTNRPVALAERPN